MMENNEEVKISASQVLEMLCEMAKDEFEAKCCCFGDIMTLFFRKNQQCFIVKIKEM